MIEKTQRKRFSGKLLPILNSVFLALLTLCASFLMLQYSTFHWDFVKYMDGLEPGLFFLNVATLGIILSALLILTNRMWLSCLLLSVLSGILGIANYYIIRYHGMPMSFLLVRNFTTAVNVLSSYSFEMDETVTTLLGVTLLLCGVCFGFFRFFLRMEKLSGKKKWGRNACLIVLSLLVVQIGYFGENPVKPKNAMTWTWTEPYTKYGFVACTIESLQQLSNAVSEPDGYSQEIIRTIDVPAPTEPAQTQTPDIILILNETFYDLGLITELETDQPVTPNIDGMENLLKGYAVVPRVGGGTNNTEYELLTSNSMELMPGVTPFNTLTLTGANSIVSHLKALGYSSLACHPEPGENYSRAIGYPALGFEQSYFMGSFTEMENYGNRYFTTDESLYRNLIRWYEEMPEEMPRFMYTLTIQNHSEHDANPPEYDIIHTKKDFGDRTETVNEFLSCIHLSDQAFKDLTDYFSSVDRPVIICMLGDHTPSVASSVVDTIYSEEEKNRLLRQVPLVIWANYPLEQGDLGVMSTNMVVPTLIEIAGIRQSPYYQYLLNVKSQIPIISSYGIYYDQSGKAYSYDNDSGTDYEMLIDNYFYLAYHNITSDVNRELFEPYA